MSADEKTVLAEPKTGGAIAWMAKNSVAANLLMLVLIVGGLLVGRTVKQEVFPEFELDTVQVGVVYPGASPEEIEQGIVLAIEEAVRGVDGVKRVTASASENVASVSVELLLGTDPNKALADVKNAVDRITSFPEEAERPEVRLVNTRSQVISVVVFGNADERSLRSLAEEVREGLLAEKAITTVELSGVRAPEVSVEVGRATLSSLGLTLPGIADRIRRSNIEGPAGQLETTEGEVLIRTTERRLMASEFAGLPILSTPGGARLRLDEIADVKETFEKVGESSEFNGMPAVLIEVFRVGDQTPVQVADAVHAYVAQKTLPPGMSIATWADQSQRFRERMNLLLKNAGMGLILVMVILGMFLEPRLAFWVTMGIPISFCGSLLLLPAMDVSISMISLFAFLVTLGIVVDDAIVVGENVYAERKEGRSGLDAAITGARRIAVPVTFSVLTTVVAFCPLLFVPGFMGKIFKVIPTIVVSVILVSLFESLFVLPAHLAHLKETPAMWIQRVGRVQARFAAAMVRFIEERYAPVLRWCLERRYLAVSFALFALIVTVGVIASGRLSFTFLPKIESDRVSAYFALPYGVNVKETEVVRSRLVAAAERVIAAQEEDRFVQGLFTSVGSHGSTGGQGRSRALGNELGVVHIQMVSSEHREVRAKDIARQWRKEVGEIEGLEYLYFRFSTGPGSDSRPIEIELQHRDMAVLKSASADLARQLGTYNGVKDVDDGFEVGKPQLDFSLTDQGRALGLSARDLSAQVRGAFFGAEAVRQQRGRDEVRVMVRLPPEERSSQHDLETLQVRLPGGGEVPLLQAARVKQGTSYTVIKRADGRRVVYVAADTEEEIANADKVTTDVKENVLPELVASYPGLSYSLEGSRRSRRESLGVLWTGFVMALFAVFALLAIPFRSYFQPLVVMSAIPFGLVGAVWGHVLLGYNISIISMMGLVATSGVVVNDSLVLVHAVNGYRAEGASIVEAVYSGGKRRFRPIVLTSLTTFFGLMPMILEPSMQARFLVPMAISLAFGVALATFVVLLVVPCFYLILEDVLEGLRRERSLEAVSAR